MYIDESTWVFIFLLQMCENLSIVWSRYLHTSSFLLCWVMWQLRITWRCCIRISFFTCIRCLVRYACRYIFYVVDGCADSYCCNTILPTWNLWINNLMKFSYYITITSLLLKKTVFIQINDKTILCFCCCFSYWRWFANSYFFPYRLLNKFASFVGSQSKITGR